jgi:hypothetical protein
LSGGKSQRGYLVPFAEVIPLENAKLAPAQAAALAKVEKPAIPSWVYVLGGLVVVAALAYLLWPESSAKAAGPKRRRRVLSRKGAR